MKKGIKSLAVPTLCGTSALILLFVMLIKKGAKPFSPTPQTPTEVPEKPTTQPLVSAIRLNEQVAKDLGLIDKNYGSSLVEIKINVKWSLDKSRWDFKETNIRRIRASKLLDFDNKAVSQASEEFLINTLKLKKNTNDNTFSKSAADDIMVITSEINPTLSKTADGSDYIVTGGTFKLQFVKISGDVNLGDNYTIDLKENQLHIPSTLDEILLIYSDFKVTQDNTNAKPGNEIDLYENLKEESYNYKKLKSLKELIDTGDNIAIKVSGRKITLGQSVWQKGDSLKVKIHFGTIIQKNDSSLILP